MRLGVVSSLGAHTNTVISVGHLLLKCVAFVRWLSPLPADPAGSCQCPYRTRGERGGATVAERYASQARTLWAAAKAAVAADQAAAFAARTSAIEQPLLATCQETDVAKQHALRAEAVTLAAEAVARIAYCRLPRIAIKKMTDADFEMHTNFRELTELDQPWVVGAFEAVGISVPQHAEHALDADTPSAPVYVPPFPNLLSGHVHQLNRL